MDDCGLPLPRPPRPSAERRAPSKQTPTCGDAIGSRRTLLAVEEALFTVDLNAAEMVMPDPKGNSYRRSVVWMNERVEPFGVEHRECVVPASRTKLRRIALTPHVARKNPANFQTRPPFGPPEPPASYHPA